MSSYCELIYIYNFIIWILTYFVGQGWCAWLLPPKFTSLICRQGGRFSCAMKIDWCSSLWKGVKVSWPSVINLWLLRFLHTLQGVALGKICLVSFRLQNHHLSWICSSCSEAFVDQGGLPNPVFLVTFFWHCILLKLRIVFVFFPPRENQNCSCINFLTMFPTIWD